MDCDKLKMHVVIPRATTKKTQYSLNDQEELRKKGSSQGGTGEK